MERLKKKKKKEFTMEKSDKHYTSYVIKINIDSDN